MMLRKVASLPEVKVASTLMQSNDAQMLRQVASLPDVAYDPL